MLWQQGRVLLVLIVKEWLARLPQNAWQLILA
jgi:hypothetical protein